MSASALYVGTVRHRRRRPTPNAFRYPVYHLLVDVDDLPALDRRLVGFGYNRAGVASFHDADHFGPLRRPVREKLAAWLARQGVDLPPGPVRVLTSPRVLGYGFNPVSWWFCHDADGRLAFVVAEVCNTFGESHSYLLDDLDRRPDGTVRATASKAFHVSPFLAIEGHRYDFTILPPDERVLVHMDVADAEGVVLDATQDERRRPLTTASLWRVLLTHPHVTLHTMLRIHRQALRLWLKRVRFHRKPTPPPTGYPATTDHPTTTAEFDRAVERPAHAKEAS